PGTIVPQNRYLRNSNGLEFFQVSGNTVVPWKGTAKANVVAVIPGSVGNVGSDTITQIEHNPYDQLSVTNPQATGGGTDPSSTPQMTVSDFDAARAQLEQGLHQAIAQQLATGLKQGEKMSETIIFNAPVPATDHQPGDKVPS